MWRGDEIVEEATSSGGCASTEMWDFCPSDGRGAPEGTLTFRCRSENAAPCYLGVQMMTDVCQQDSGASSQEVPVDSTSSTDVDGGDTSSGAIGGVDGETASSGSGGYSDSSSGGYSGSYSSSSDSSSAASTTTIIIVAAAAGGAALLAGLVLCLLCRRCRRRQAHDLQLALFAHAKPGDGSANGSVDGSAGALEYINALAAAEAGMTPVPPTLPATPTAEPELPVAQEMLAPVPATPAAELPVAVLQLTPAARRAAALMEEPKTAPGFWAFAYKTSRITPRRPNFGSPDGRAAIVADVHSTTHRCQHIDAWLAETVGASWHGCIMYNDHVPGPLGAPAVACLPAGTRALKLQCPKQTNTPPALALTTRRRIRGQQCGRPHQGRGAVERGARGLAGALVPPVARACQAGRSHRPARDQKRAVLSSAVLLVCGPAARQAGHRAAAGHAHEGVLGRLPICHLQCPRQRVALCRLRAPSLPAALLHSRELCAYSPPSPHQAQVYHTCDPGIFDPARVEQYARGAAKREPDFFFKRVRLRCVVVQCS